MASATPSPYDHRWRRYAMVWSQSIAASSQGSFAESGSATMCAAPSALRVNGREGLANTLRLAHRIVFELSARVASLHR